MKLIDLNQNSINNILNEFKKIAFEFWVSYNILLQKTKNMLNNTYDIEYSKVVILGESENITLYIYDENYILIITPLSDISNNILLKELLCNKELKCSENNYLLMKNDRQIKEKLNVPQIVLINLCVVENFPIPRLNLSTGVIAGFLRKNQLAEVTIIDMQTGTNINEILQKCIDITPDIIGISISFGQKELANSILSKLIEHNIKSLITIGNIIPALYPLEFLNKFPNVIVSYGEGESTIPDLIKYIKGKTLLENVNGIIYRNRVSDKICTTSRNEIEMSEVPLPALDTLESIAKLKGVLTLETSRGCNYSHCTFCPRQHKLNKWRYMSANQTISQIEKLLIAGNRLKMKPHIYLADEEFIGHLPNGKESERIIAICNGIIDKKLKMKFDTSARADSVYNPNESLKWNLEKIKMWHLCRDAGLDRLFVGVESGCNAQLKRYGKGTIVEQNVIALRILTALGIDVRIGFVMFDPLMIGFDDLKDNLNFLERRDAILNPVDITNISYEELYNLLVYNEDFVKKNSKNTPIYSVVSYMLASLEVLVGAPYMKMIQDVEKSHDISLVKNNGKPDANMGRYIVGYQDPIIGKLSSWCQKWIDSNFSIMYTIKSLYKSEKDYRKKILHNYMERHREISQFLLRYLIYNIEINYKMDATFSNYIKIVDSNRYIDLLLEKYRSEDVDTRIERAMNNWQILMKQLVNDIKSDLEVGIIQDTYDSRLSLAIEKWYQNFNKWYLINDMDIDNTVNI